MHWRASRSTEADDARDQMLVLEAVMEVHPARMTMEELVRELAAPGDIGEAGRAEAAVRDLVGSGLLHLDRRFVSATRATVRLEELRGAGGL